jgi:hypothetical protein
MQAMYPRRLLLNGGAIFSTSALLACVSSSASAPPVAPTGGASPGGAGKTPPAPTGKGVGDFEFLAGSWKVHHRKLKTGPASANDWELFEGEATVWSALGGIASIEELRVPSRNFSGMGIRLLDVTKRLWADYWVSGRDGILTPPPMWGGFENGVGTWLADDTDEGAPIKVRGVWDRITPSSCRWHQAVSRDGGKTWEGSWFMDWVRA